ncbi:HNH endonuclease [Streptomyces sp. NPDC007020]|uniref:HNH endonuclease n=1 Tax=Streptomyces sp. NPDC007020 TaxID=3154585 RepID=UPI00340FD04D
MCRRTFAQPTARQGAGGILSLVAQHPHGPPLCPFCGKPLLPEQELSQDHVFLDSFGGKCKVRARRSCNNQSGAEAELQQPARHRP